jgi:hypothetical protein
MYVGWGGGLVCSVIVAPSIFAVVCLLSGCVPHYKHYKGPGCLCVGHLVCTPPLVARTGWDPRSLVMATFQLLSSH